MSTGQERGIPRGVAAGFFPDLVAPPIPRRSHEFVAPDSITSRLQSSIRAIDQPHALVAAVRILNFRYSDMEVAYVAVFQPNVTPNPHTVSLSVDSSTPLEHVVETARVLMEKAVSEGGVGTKNNVEAGMLVEFPTSESSDDLKPEFDLIWRFLPNKKFKIVYNSTLYSQNTIEMLSNNFIDVLGAVLTVPHIPVTDIELPHALDQLRQLGVPLKRPWPTLLPRYLVDAFEQIVRSYGSEIALVQQTLYLTYNQIDVLSSILAERLSDSARLAQSSNRRIACCIPPSGLAVITILAIVKTGCAYVPLDVRDPPGRRVSILEDSGASCLVVTNASPEFALNDDLNVSITDISDFLNGWRDLVSGPPPSRTVERHAMNESACLLYTSGTTGKPKGVQITQRSIVAFVSNKDLMPCGPGSKVPQVTNLAWDGHIVDIWTSLLSGSTLYCFSRFDVLDPSVLATMFQLAEIDICFFPTALFRHVLAIRPELFQSLKHLLVGGELSHFQAFHEARAVNPQLTIANVYGPTETCAFATGFVLSPDSPPRGPVPIGVPIGTARAHVVDSHGRLVPPGVVGELLIGGDGVADGYHDRPQETAKAFVEMKFKGLDSSPSMFYRTGDRARWSFDGQIEYLGRMQSGQVKIRGQRLELEEVEATIIRETGVRDAGVVCYKASKRAEPTLVAYLVMEHSAARDNDLEKTVSTWTDFYDESYSDDVVKIREQFIGWDSMTTGQQIPHVQMQDWLRDTLRPFFDRKPRTVFEVGCGIGIILYGMVPFVDRFYALEPSSTGVERLQKQITEDGFSEKVSLWATPADKIHALPDFKMDFSLINSVAQYFPSEDYLQDTLLQLVKRSNPGSQIMLGDVRSAPLDDFLAINIITEQWKNELETRTVQDLLDRVAERRQYRTELLVDPSFFYDLQRQEQRITHVEVMPKFMQHNNELSRYRYQVILHVLGEEKGLVPDAWVSPGLEDPGFSTLPQLLEDFVQGSESILAIERIPNKFFLQEEAFADVAYASSTDAAVTLSSLTGIVPELTGWSAFDLAELAKSHGLSVRLSFARQAESTGLDAVFSKAPTAPLVAFKPAILNPLNGLQIHRSQRAKREPPRLRNVRFHDVLEAMKATLPAHMMPESLYAVEWLPLTSNSKLDRRMLAEMAGVDYQRGLTGKQGFAGDGPRNETESTICDLFSNVLSGVTVTRSTDFFAQGGHSLLATRLRSALEREFQVQYPLQDLFNNANPATIARKVQELQYSGSSLVTRVEKSELTGEFSDLSFAQGRLWFLHQLVPGEVEYICPWLLDLIGDVDEVALETAIAEIARRHDILRTVFVEVDGVPKSKTTDIVPTMERISIDPSTSEDDVKAIVMGRAIRPLDLSAEPVIKPVLFKRGPKHHVFCLIMHHIITDGASYDILRHEMIEIYTAIVEGRPWVLPELTIQYKDFASWQRTPEFKELIRPQEDYWVSYLKGSKPARFPADHERASVFHNEAGMVKLSCEAELRDKLWSICQREHVTWFMLLMSVFRAVHFQWTGASDASFGSPIANRHRPEVEGLLGFFVNTQVFRIKVHQGQRFFDLLRSTRELSLKAFEHQDIPFDRLVEVLDPPRSALQNPLIEIMFAFQSFNMTTFSLPNVDVEWFGFHRGTTRFDLEAHWWERLNELECIFFYRKAIFEDATIERLSSDVKEMLQRIVEDPDFKIVSDKADLDEVEEVPVIVHPAFAEDTALEPDGPPQNEIEEQVCLTFEKLLGVPVVTRQTNFFDCGGHSLLVTRACSQLKQAYNVQVEIRDIFERPTPVALARHIGRLVAEASEPEQAISEKVSSAESETGQSTAESSTENRSSTPDSSSANSSLETSATLPLIPSHYIFTNTPNRPNLFCIPACSGISTVYSALARAAVAENFNVIGINDPTLSNIDVDIQTESETWSFIDLAKNYYKQVLKVEKELYHNNNNNNTDSQNLTPLNLLGFSAGGNLSLEIARSALLNGRKVNLFIIDTLRNEIHEHLAQGISISPEEIEKSISISTEFLLNSLATTTTTATPPNQPNDQATLLEMARTCTMSNLRRFYAYTMQEYPGHAVFFRTEANITQELTGRIASVDEVQLAGHHFGLLSGGTGSQVGVIARKVGEVIFAQTQN
ncbi:NRPS [Onygenales sp. PD_40]|nr:NRPS [Onygenales sp. PD_40]KAK2786545.1 NRPS [Emmonsiellopsis sp. PD_33]KAK2800173.1 NRPS [Onygenales sp. PD_10]